MVVALGQHCGLGEGAAAGVTLGAYTHQEGARGLLRNGPLQNPSFLPKRHEIKGHTSQEARELRLRHGEELFLFIAFLLFHH